MDEPNTLRGRTVDDLVECAGCTKVAGTPVRHLPPSCEYVDGQQTVAPEGVADLTRARLSKSEPRPALGRLHDVLGVFMTEHFPADARLGEDIIDSTITVLRRLMAVEAQRAAYWTVLEDQKRQLDRLALFFRESYKIEIQAGKHNHFLSAADAAIHYLMVERDLTHRGMWGRLKYLLWGV